MGTPTQATQGRPKGVMNRNQKFLWNKLRDMYGEDFDPVMRMAQSAVHIQKQGDIAVQNYEEKESPTIDDLAQLFNILANCMTAWEKVANFTSPKYRAIEFSTELGVEGAALITDGMSAKEAAAEYMKEVLTA